MKVEQLMTRDVLTASPETSLKEVAGTLSSHGVSGLPVVGGEGHVLGVISEADILGKPAARIAGEAMTSPALTIEPGRPASEAAKLMVEKGINRLPVVAHGSLVGIVTRADLVRAFTRADEEIEREIRDDVLLNTLWIDPDRVSISVSNGEVSLAGEVETRTQAELVEAYVRRVPGVVDVQSELEWSFDDFARRIGGRTRR